MAGNSVPTEEAKEDATQAPCVVCGEQRPQSAINAGDPYCSAGCCQEAYRVPQRPLLQPWAERKAPWERCQGPKLGGRGPAGQVGR